LLRLKPLAEQVDEHGLRYALGKAIALGQPSEFFG